MNDLLASGGLSGSAWTISVVFAALSLGGLLERTGVLAVLATTSRAPCEAPPASSSAPASPPSR